MDLKRKKIIAKEVLILSSLIAIVFITYCILWIVELDGKSRIKDLNNKNLIIKAKIDSIENRPIDLSAFDEVVKNSELGIPYKSEELPPIPKGLTVVSEELPPPPPKNFTPLNDKVPSNRPPIKLVGIERLKKWLTKADETIDSLNASLKLNNRTIKSISFFDKDEILSKLILIMLVIVYPFRGLILLVKWSIKTVKE
jgi:hypothetical protein